MPRGRRWVAVVDAARSSMGRGRRCRAVVSDHPPSSPPPPPSRPGGRGSALLGRGGPPFPGTRRAVALPPVPQSAPWSARRPSLGVRFVLSSCPSGRSCVWWRCCPVHNRHSAHSQGPSGRSGLFAGSPRCPFRAPAPGAAGAPRGPPRAGALATLGTAVVATLLFFSAGAALCGQGFRGFPLGAVARGLPPSTPARVPATCRHFLSAPGARGDPAAVLGALPLRPSRGARRPPPCTPGRPDAGGGVFHGILALRRPRRS